METAEITNAAGFIASIIEQANECRNRLADVPAEEWADLMSLLSQADDIVDDALAIAERRS